MEDLTLSYLKAASEVAHQVNTIQTDINNLNMQLNRCRNRKTTASTCTILGFSLGWLISLIGVAIMRVAFHFTASTFVILWLFFTVLIIVGGTLLDYKITKVNKVKQENDAANLMNIINSRNDILANFLDDNSEIVSKVPGQYFYPIAIDYFIEVLSNGRADTFKEAMNLFEEQLHRWKIEDMTKSSMIAQQQTAANSAAIRTSSAINAAANVANLMSRR